MGAAEAINGLGVPPATRIVMSDGLNALALYNIMKKTVEKCKKGVTIECEKCCSEKGVPAYVPLYLYTWHGNPHLCLEAYCPLTNTEKQRRILHELTHYGGSLDDVNGPTDGTFIEDAVPQIAEALDK